MAVAVVIAFFYGAFGPDTETEREQDWKDLLGLKCIEGGNNMDKKLTDEQIKELAREIQREYLREWRKRNPDKVREYNERYWRRRAIRELKENKTI